MLMSTDACWGYLKLDDGTELDLSGQMLNRVRETVAGRQITALTDNGVGIDEAGVVIGDANYPAMDPTSLTRLNKLFAGL